MPYFNQGHALVIGVGEYQDPDWCAPITVADAQGVVDALKDQQVSAYPSNQVAFLHDQEATCEGITTALKQLAGDVKATDTVVLFFCGHGLLGTDNEYYFATQEAVFTADDKIQADTGLKGSDLISLLRAIEAKKLLFIINACFSGHLNPTLGARVRCGVAPSATLGIEVLNTGEGRALITASRPSQFSSYADSQKHTYFGQALIDGMRGAQGVANSDGYIGLYELYQHIYKSVTTVTNKAQEPVLTILQGVGPFPVAHYPGATPGTLGGVALQQTPPRDMAVEVVERKVAQVVGAGGQAFNITGSSNVSIDQSKLLDFSGAHISGGIKTGDIARGNITKINITTTAAAAASVSDMQALLRQVESLQVDVTKLTDAPKGLRKDVEYALSAAKEAGEEDDRDRLREKLEAAQKSLLGISASIPTVAELAQTLGTLLQQAMRV